MRSGPMSDEVHCFSFKNKIPQLIRNIINIREYEVKETDRRKKNYGNSKLIMCCSYWTNSGIKLISKCDSYSDESVSFAII